MFKRAMIVISLSMLFFATAAHAKSVDAKSDLALALKDMEILQGFSTTFKQVLSYAEGGQRIYTGELAVSRPGKFRWEYLTPYAQVYVSNGQGVWLYEPDLMQAQLLQDIGEVDPVVLQLLDGRIGLMDIDVLDQSLEQNITIWQVRIGKKEQAVEVWLGVRENTLYWIESRDVLLNKNRLYLLNLKTNTPPASRFEFVAPNGVDVIGVAE